MQVPRPNRRTERALGVAASLVVHLAMLTAFVLGAQSVFRIPPVENDMRIELLRPADLRPPLQPRPAAAPTAAAIRPHEPRTPPSPAAPAPFVVPPAPPAPTPAPAAPRPAEARAPLLGLGEAMQKVLGCNDSARAGMTEAQRAACDRREGEESRTAKRLPLMIPPDKKRAWDLEMWKRHRPTNQPFVPCTGPGSNFGFYCIPDKQRAPPPSDD